MKIGLTGATGFIGQHLLKDYAGSHTFIAATSHADDRGFYRHSNIRYVFSDYSVDSYRSIFAGCDCIVHLGAVKSSPGAEKKMESFYGSITACENIFYAAQCLGIENIVNISSRCVYHPSLPKPFKEELTAPLNRYGTAKLCTESIAEIFNRNYGMKIKSLRLAQVLGLGMRREDLPAVYLSKSLAKEPLSVYGKGASRKEYIYIKDVTAAVLKACRHSECSGAFNIGSRESTSNLELAQAYCSVFENPEGIQMLPDKAEDGLSFLMDVTKARRQLGFHAVFHLADALCDMKRELEEKK